MGGIPLDWLVNVTSSGVRDTFSLSKLPTLLITKTTSLPSPQWNKFYDSTQVGKVLGIDTEAKKFADNYFSFTSKKSSRADLLNVLVYNDGDLAPYLLGTRADSLEKLKALNGKFSISINGTVKDVEVDLSEANSYSDVATKLKEAINLAGAGTIDAFTKANVTFNTQTSGFIVKGGALGEGATISTISAPTSGTDISGGLGLSEANGAVTFDGRGAIPTFTQLLELIGTTNGDYFVIQFDYALNDNELLEFCKWVDLSNDRYLGIVNSQDNTIIQNEGVLSAYEAYNGVLFEYSPNNSVLGFSAGIISALDFSQSNGNVNIAFNDATKFQDIAITTKQELNILEANKANSILKFSQIGQSQVWYGMGNIMGTKTNNANIYVCNAYLKVQLQFALANMFNSQSMIGLRGGNNEAIVFAYLNEVFLKSVNAGIIVEGAELTTTERQVLLKTFKNGETAVTQCQRQGYFYEISGIDLKTQKLNIITAYVANKPIKQIVINNYILGA